MIKIGWGPYAHEYAHTIGIAGDIGWGDKDMGQDQTARYKYSDAAVYYLAHIGKVLQGFYSDLNINERVWNKNSQVEDKKAVYDGNVHPARDNLIAKTMGTTQLDGNYAEPDRPLNYPTITKGYQAGAGNIETNFEAANPLTITRTLSGVCYPTIKEYGYSWKNLFLMESTSGLYKDMDLVNPFTNFQHWGQQREKQDSPGTNQHSAFFGVERYGVNREVDYTLTPDSWYEVVKKISENNPTAFNLEAGQTFGEKYGWSHDANGNARTLESIKREILNEVQGTTNHQYTQAEIKAGWNTSHVERLQSNFPIREHQEINSNADKAKDSKQVTLYNERVGTQGTPETEFGIGLSGEAIGSADFNQDKLDSAGTDINIRADFNDSFPSFYMGDKGDEDNNIWMGLSDSIYNKLEGLSEIFPRIYLNDIRYGTEAIKDSKAYTVEGRYGQSGYDIQNAAVPINAFAVSDWQAPNTDIIDLKDFIKSYVKWDRGIGGKPREWEKKDYWSAWDAAYQETVKGKWGLEGSGLNLIAAKADMSGQALLYSELINKFHYIDEANAIHTSETINSNPMAGWGNKDTDADNITYTVGWGNTEAEAEANAVTALKHELRSLLHTTNANGTTAGTYPDGSAVRSIPASCGFSPAFNIHNDLTWMAGTWTADPLDALT